MPVSNCAFSCASESALQGRQDKHRKATPYNASLEHSPTYISACCTTYRVSVVCSPYVFHARRLCCKRKREPNLNDLASAPPKRVESPLLARHTATRARRARYPVGS